MEHQNLLKKIAKLETVNDQLVAELDYLDRLSRALGFAEGIKTLKSAALELLAADRKTNKTKPEKPEKKSEF